eukprot:gene10004-2177_t
MRHENSKGDESGTGPWRISTSDVRFSEAGENMNRSQQFTLTKERRKRAKGRHRTSKDSVDNSFCNSAIWKKQLIFQNAAKFHFWETPLMVRFKSRVQAVAVTVVFLDELESFNHAHVAISKGEEPLSKRQFFQFNLLSGVNHDVETQVAMYFLVSIEVHHTKPWKAYDGRRLLSDLRAAILKYHGDFGAGSLSQSLARTIRTCQRALIRYNGTQLRLLVTSLTPAGISYSWEINCLLMYVHAAPLSKLPILNHKNLVNLEKERHSPAIQPNEETRTKQLEAWQQLVVAYAQTNQIDRLVVSESTSMELFNNKSINRALDSAGIITVLDHLNETGHAEWKNSAKEECALYWRSPREWGDIIYKWAVDTGHTDAVCTFFELLEGDTGEGQEFQRMDRHVFQRALEVLQKEGKAEVFSADDDDDSSGVKFFML